MQPALPTNRLVGYPAAHCGCLQSRDSDSFSIDGFRITGDSFVLISPAGNIPRRHSLGAGVSPSTDSDHSDRRAVRHVAGGADQSIVGTALPRIVSDLGGLNHLAWVVTAYLLTSTATTPLWGKISDLYGRRIIFQATIVIFLIGSALCGLAQTMPQLIIFRAIQGIGGGGLMAIAFAIIGDVIPARERGRYTGYFGAVFGVSSLAGPLLGGWITQNLSWRWIFYINLPIGIVALVVTSIVLKMPVIKRDAKIDYLGATAIVAGVTSLLLYLNWAGEQFGWTSPQALAFVIAAVALTISFVFIELRCRNRLSPCGSSGTRSSRLGMDSRFWLVSQSLAARFTCRSICRQ